MVQQTSYLAVVVVVVQFTNTTLLFAVLVFVFMRLSFIAYRISYIVFLFQVLQSGCD